MVAVRHLGAQQEMVGSSSGVDSLRRHGNLLDLMND
jgi:hypothetical protein